ncbi:hypothetical protein [Niveibacterium sp.]|uniref:hypothetical protein n=1 Tax=Niveibacterium sp. TaxID=2017444 RepID=UPI0035AE46B9
MDANIYAPPKACVADVEGGKEVAHPFYVVAPRKFLALFVATLGFYLVFWFYLNWRRYKTATGVSVLPAVRAVFSVFFVHALFRAVDLTAELRGVRVQWDRRSIATQMVVFLILGNMMDRMSAKGLWLPYSDVFSFLCLAVLAFLGVKAQAAINGACGDPSGRSNATFSKANIFWIVAGCFMWVLVIIGFVELALH